MKLFLLLLVALLPLSRQQDAAQLAPVWERALEDDEAAVPLPKVPPPGPPSAPLDSPPDSSAPPPGPVPPSPVPLDSPPLDSSAPPPGPPGPIPLESPPNSSAPPSGPVPPGPPPPGAPPLGPPPAFPDDGVPPGFAEVLPTEVIDQLRQLHKNPKLSFPEKRAEFDRIMNSLPGETLAKLPFPPGFNALPSQVKDKIQAIHINPNLSWNEKSKQIGQLIEALPATQRQFLPGAPPGMGRKRLNFPPTPPPGFEHVLSKETYDKLLLIHQDPQLTPKEKIHKIDTVMRSLPQETLDALPLPPGFEQLPPDTVKEARAIFSDKSLDYDSKNKKIIKFIKSLPPAQQALVKPPPPPAISALPREERDKIESIFDDENLNEDERHAEFWKYVETLSPEKRAQIHQQLGDGTEPHALNESLNEENPMMEDEDGVLLPPQ